MRLAALAVIGSLALPGAAFAADTTPPTIKITHPRDGSVITMLAGPGTTSVTGKVSDAESGLQRVTLNGRTVEPDPDGSFFADQKVRRGKNDVTVTAVDRAGNEASKTVHFIYKPPSSGGGGSSNVLRDPRGDAHGSDRALPAHRPHTRGDALQGHGTLKNGPGV